MGKLILPDNYKSQEAPKKDELTEGMRSIVDGLTEKFQSSIQQTPVMLATSMIISYRRAVIDTLNWVKEYNEAASAARPRSRAGRKSASAPSNNNPKP